MSVLEKNKYFNLNYHIKLRRLKLESKLKHLQNQKEEILRAVDKTIGRIKATFLGLTLLQFGFFYHCIFNIEWLGWDIMEPITYSLEMAKFLVFLRFFYMYKQEGHVQGIYQMLTARFCEKNPETGAQLEMMEQQIKNTEEKLAVVYDYDFIYN